VRSMPAHWGLTAEMPGAVDSASPGPGSAPTWETRLTNRRCAVRTCTELPLLPAGPVSRTYGVAQRRPSRGPRLATWDVKHSRLADCPLARTRRSRRKRMRTGHRRPWYSLRPITASALVLGLVVTTASSPAPVIAAPLVAAPLVAAPLVAAPLTAVRVAGTPFTTSWPWAELKTVRDRYSASNKPMFSEKEVQKQCDYD
jgi:hypothetical protein